MRKIVTCGALAIMLLLTTACSPFKTATTKDEFTQTVQQLNYEVEDYTEFAQGLVVASLVAKGQNGVVVEFFEMLDKEQAQAAFEDNRVEMDAHKTTNFVERKTSGINYKKYELTTGEEYLVVCQVDATLLYVLAPKEAKEQVQELLKQLGY